jgi:catechol 2,3-dioxygenase-like lactoylglutathione lyase family enzyme
MKRRYTGIHHLAMITDDMDKTVRFWRDLLGMPMIATMGDGRYRQYFFEISDRDMLSFFEWPGATNPDEKDHGVPVTTPLAFDHLAIGVDSEDELLEIQTLLDDAGFIVSGVVDHGFIKSIYTFDPNNIPIEFCLDIPGKDLRTVPLMADRFPSPVALEGSEPRNGKWPS